MNVYSILCSAGCQARAQSLQSLKCLSDSQTNLQLGDYLQASDKDLEHLVGFLFSAMFSSLLFTGLVTVPVLCKTSENAPAQVKAPAPLPYKKRDESQAIKHDCPSVKWNALRFSHQMCFPLQCQWVLLEPGPPSVSIWLMQVYTCSTMLTLVLLKLCN